MVQQIKLLTLNDYDLIEQLLKKKSKISNTPSDNWDWEQWKKNFHHYLTNENCRVIGCLEDNVLKAFVVQQFLIQIPAWVMVLIAQEQNDWLRIGHGDYLNACLLDAVRSAEERGVFDVLYSVPTKWLKTTARTQPTSPVWSRYNVYIDAIIEAGSVPKYALHRFICGEIPKKHDRAIKRCSLKMQYRTNYFSINKKSLKDNL